MELKINNQVVHDMNGNALNYKFDHFPDIHEEIKVDGTKYLVREVTREVGKPDMVTVGNKQELMSHLYIKNN